MHPKFLSRKLFIVIFALVLITVALLSTVWLPLITSSLPTFYGTVVALVGAYLAGNVMASKTNTKNTVSNVSRGSAIDEDEV